MISYPHTWIQREINQCLIHPLAKHPVPGDHYTSISPLFTPSCSYFLISTYTQCYWASYSPALHLSRLLDVDLIHSGCFSSFSLQAHLMPWATSHWFLSIPKLILLNEALQGGSFGHMWRQALCQGTCNCQRVKKKKKEGEGERRRRGGREESSIVPFLCLHTEGYWVRTLESELQADRRGGKQCKKNKRRKPKQQRLWLCHLITTALACIVWNAYLVLLSVCAVNG